MSWCIHGPVDKDEDCRDPAGTQRIIRLAERGVVVVGPSRIGKTSLLHRVIENLGPRFDSPRPIHLSSESKDTFARMEKATGWLVFDEAQHLLDWTPQALGELHRRLKDRPFVLAAWPILMRPDAPIELQRLLEDVKIEPLHPLSREETARMVRRAWSQTPLACEENVVEAIHRATAGFPNLVARLCRFLMHAGTEAAHPPTEDELAGFIDSVEDFDDPFQAIYTSLPPKMQQLLDGARLGTGSSLEALRQYGLVAGSPASFSGSLFGLVWGSGSTWEPRVPRAAPGTVRPRPSGPKPALTWLHVSDLHFGAGEVQKQQKHRFNQEVVIEAIRQDVEKNLPWIPDHVFVTGDIAFSAKPEQYQQAAQWLRKLIEAAGTSTAALRVVPGNHDVDRSMAEEPHVEGSHASIRAKPGSIDDHLQKERSRTLLGDKLAAYVRFLEELAPNHPRGADNLLLDWSEQRAPTSEQPGRVWFVGLCSVWVSDKNDAERKLVIGERQLRSLQQVKEEDLLLLLTHHPPGWLHPDAEDLLLERMMERGPHLHLCGHVHVARARALRSLGISRESVRLVAGAGHGESSEQHGYAWGAFRWNQGRWELGWAPRVFVKGVGMRADSNRYNLDGEGFAWTPLELKWGAPGQERGKVNR
ncbi:metallophosphoesterase [Archangium violaceum]|uniref:metallophosphoesterase n=1 Tax=Archangium violaceum TaxID=83451 RepID=UPI0019511F42|nr:metallophosphoesterase [Archangium violaceum]QRN98886.1 metallophosphoesterase [Archangium violaceum]